MKTKKQPDQGIATDHLKMGVLTALLMLMSLLLLTACDPGSTNPEEENSAPVIRVFEVTQEDTSTGDSVTLDTLGIPGVPEDDILHFFVSTQNESWDALTTTWWSRIGENYGVGEWDTVAAGEEYADWYPVGLAGERVQLGVRVVDDFGYSDEATLWVDIEEADTSSTNPIDNEAPVIFSTQMDVESVSVGDTVGVMCFAYDPDGEDEDLIYNWAATGGSLLQTTGSSIDWLAPLSSGEYSVYVSVYDGEFTTRDTLDVTVYEPPFDMEFTSQEDVDRWSLAGPLAGYGENNILYDSLGWNEAGEAMEVSAWAWFATQAFPMSGETFGNGIFSIECSVPGFVYGNVAFIPKYYDLRNYFLITVDFERGYYSVVRCSRGDQQFLAGDWITGLEADTPYEFRFQREAGTAKAWFNGAQLWSGQTSPDFDPPAQVAVGLYGREQSGPVLFDNLRFYH